MIYSTAGTSSTVNGFIDGGFNWKKADPDKEREVNFTAGYQSPWNQFLPVN
jgi:hypothetical protein